MDPRREQNPVQEKQEVLDGVTAGGAPARKALRVSEHQEEEEEDDRSSLQ